MRQAAEALAASDRWRRAFLELWRAFDRFSLALLQERYGVGGSGSEIDRFALRRAVATLLPPAVKRQALAAPAVGGLLERRPGVLDDAALASYRQAPTDDAGQELTAALLDLFFALHGEAAPADDQERCEGDGPLWRWAYQALIPLVDHLSGATATSREG